MTVTEGGNSGGGGVKRSSSDYVESNNDSNDTCNKRKKKFVQDIEEEESVAALSVETNKVLKDETIVRKLVYFAGSDCKQLIHLRQVNKLFKDTVDSSLHWKDTNEVDAKDQSKGIVRNILQSNYGIPLFPVWGKIGPEHATLNLKSLAFFEKCREAGILEKKPVPGHDPNVPFAVSRCLKLFEVLETFPDLKAQWEEHGARGDFNVVEGILAYLECNGFLPHQNGMNMGEHLKIILMNARKYSAHPIYNEYRQNMPANIHVADRQTLNLLYNNLTYTLKCLIAPETRFIRF